MKRLIALAGWLTLASPALAGQAVTLKAETLDSDGVVTLGDLFDGAGAAAQTPVASKAGATVVLDAGAVQVAARRAGLNWANAEGFRRIVVRSGAPAGAVTAGNVEVLTWARSINAGEVIQPQDLVWSKAAAAPADAPSDAEAVIGMSARRPLRSGAAASTRDVAAPMVIKTGELISVAFEDVGISLSMQGKAMANASVGDTFAVQNPISKKVVQAVATGPGQAVVGPAAAQFRAQRPARYAYR